MGVMRSFRWGVLQLCAGIVLSGGCLVARAAQYIVHPDGSGDFATIQAALDAAVDGDIIELADGVFTGHGNRDLDFHGLAATVRSASGHPESCVLNLEGSAGAPHRGFHFNSAEGPGTRVIGLTICNGYAEYGGALLIEGTSPYFESCILVGNAATFGGAIARIHGAPEMRNVTVTDNRAEYGGAIFTAGMSGLGPTLHDSILIGNCAVFGDDLYLDDGTYGFYCCCVDFTAMDGIGIIAYTPDCFATDPQFCQPRECVQAPFVGGDYHISAQSPCVPLGNACHVWVGALGIGCEDPVPVEPLTWGAIKARYSGERAATSRLAARAARPSQVGGVTFVVR